MRISAWTIWPGLALLAGAAAPGDVVTFATDKFTGINNTAILSYSVMMGGGDTGYMFEWHPSQAEGGPTLASLILADLDGAAIITLEANDTNMENYFGVDWLHGSVTLYKPFLESNLTSYMNSTALFFQLEWSYEHGDEKRKRAIGSTYSYSPLWAVAASDETARGLLNSYSNLSSPAEAYESQGSAPAVQPYATAASASPASEPSSPTTTSSSSPTSQGGKNTKSKSLSTGAIAGIVIGGVVALLIAVSLGAGCLCLVRSRNRRRCGAGGGDGHHRTMQNLMADKEARAIMETAPDTPYSERDDSQHAMHLRHPSSLSPSRLGGGGESVVDMTSTVGDVASHHHHRGSGIVVGAAITTGGGARDGDSPTNNTNHHNGHDDNVGDDNITELERASMMGSPTLLRISSQQERSFTPYTDRPPTDYSQHHRVVDGADLVQQEQSNSKTTNNNKQTPANHQKSGSPVIIVGEYTEEQHQNQQQQRPPPTTTSNIKNSSDSTTTTTNVNSINSSSNHNSPHPLPELRPARFARARSATPSGILGRYAHLVEDGMTDDEIRRLEEEERALDEAIEHAATTTTTNTTAAAANTTTTTKITSTYGGREVGR